MPTDKSAHKTEIILHCGDLQFTYRVNGGVELFYKGIPVLQGSSLWIMNPGWVSRIYGVPDRPGLLEDAEILTVDGGYDLIIHHHTNPVNESPFTGKEVYQLRPNSSYRITLEGQVKNRPAFVMEWLVGGLNPYLFLNKNAQVQYPDGSGSSIEFPLNARGSSVNESTFAKGFQTIRTDSRLGEITIESSLNPNLIFFDFRKNQWAVEGKPVFWLGMTETPLPGNQPFRYSLSIQFTQSIKQDMTVHPTWESDEEIIYTPTARVPRHDPQYFIPEPKQWKFTGEDYPIGDNSLIWVKDPDNKDIKSSLDFLNQELSKYYGKTLPICGHNELPPWTMVITDKQSINSIQLPEIQNHKEGYSLLTDTLAVKLKANHPKGFFYGITTLAQSNKIDLVRCYYKGVVINDWPSLDFRGVHLFTGKDNPSEITHMVRNVLARYKINTLIWECEYLVWDCHPELAHPEYAMTKKDAQQVIQTCQHNQVEIVPLVQSLGHSEWIFSNGYNLDLAEDPEHPYAYNPTNPKSYDFIFEVYREALDLFKPRYFHIGHDEVTTEGRFPWRSKDTGKSITELVLGDIEILYNWFKSHQVQIMMWFDMYIMRGEAPDATNAPSMEEALYRRKKLPKDIIATDWHYATVEPEKYSSIGILKKEGFPVIGAAWDQPGNIRNLALACIQNKALGFIQTTWAGFTFSVESNEKAWNQYWAYIWAADYAWSGRREIPQELPYNARQLFLDQWFEKPVLRQSQPGFHINLDPLVNTPLQDTIQQNQWVGLGPELDLRHFNGSSDLESETLFRISELNGLPAAIMLEGQFNPKGDYPGQVILKLNGIYCQEWHFLLTCSFPAGDNRKVASVLFRYCDGTEYLHPLIYGKDVFAFSDIRCSRNTRLAWTGKTQSGQLAALNEWICYLPHSSKRISELVFQSENTETALLVLAVTGVTES